MFHCQRSGFFSGCCRTGVATLAMMVLLVGCSDAPTDLPKLGKVSGVVTLNGKPLPNAIVSFIPFKGAPSAAITDAEGKYVLHYKNGELGAAIGEHRVEVSTDLEGTKKKGDEKVPANYNTQTTLLLNVKEGENTHDLTL